MPTRGAARAAATARLAQAGVPTPALDADLLVAHAAGVTKESLVAHPEVPLDDAAAARLEELVRRRAAGEPVAYLRGWKEFYGLRFAVDARVLVPRPETEQLVDAVRAHARGRRLTVADVGTGSGAIAVTLAVHEPQLRIIATDVSADALAVAATNAAAHRVAIELREGDLFAPLDPPVDVVAANLPYLRADALDDLAGDRTSLAFEPRLATVSGADGLDLLRRAAADLPGVLAPAGAAFFECDPPQAGALAALLAPLGTVRVLADLAGTDRLVVLERRSPAAPRGARAAAG